MQRTWRIISALVNKRNQEEKEVHSGLVAVLDSLMTSKSYLKMAELVAAIAKLPNQSVYRKEFVRDIYQTLLDAERLGLSAS